MIDRLHNFLLRHVAPPRFILFGVLFAAGLFIAVPVIGPAIGTMAAFDVASAVFLATIVPLLDDVASSMRRKARANDANRTLLLALTGVVMLVILVSVASEVRHRANPATIGLAMGTLALAWLFSNTIYALHYAKLFYSGGEGEDDSGDRGGLSFPDTDEPNYWDFAYFSFTLGMTFQTSDVSITHTAMRRTVIGQCLAAFVFNIGVLAFSINVLGSN